MTRATERCRALAHALEDLEHLINTAKERTNVVWVLSQLTIAKEGRRPSVEETAALIWAIEDADDASARLLERWTEHQELTAIAEMDR